MNGEGKIMIDETLILEFVEMLMKQESVENLQNKKIKKILQILKNKENIIAGLKRDMEELKNKLSQVEEGKNISQYESEMAQLNYKISNHKSDERSINNSKNLITI